MSHVAFVCPPFRGHLDPMAAIAARLVARGHRATVLHMADAGPLLRGGTDFVALGPATHPPGTLAVMTGHIGALSPSPLGGPAAFVALRRVLHDLAATTDMLCAELPARLRELGVDLIVADQTEAAGGLVARHLGLPYVSVANALPINEEPGVPPPFTAWPYEDSPAARRRNTAGYRVSRMLSGPLNRVIARRAAEWGLGKLHTLTDCLSPAAQISQMPAALDFPRAERPASFRYVGPLRLAAGAEPDLAMEPPYAFVTLGTLQGARFGLLTAIAKACRAAGLGCLVAHGGRLSPVQAAELARIATVRDFVNQRAVLRHAAITVTHGGLNTVLDALAAGVPVVAVPLAFEQAAIGARLAWAGVGRVAQPASLAAALGDASCAARAREFAGLVPTDGAERAADIIEGLAGRAM